MAFVRRTRNFLALVLSLILAVSIFRMFLPLFGTFLLVRDNVQRADAIAVLRGEDEFFRFRKGVELYKEGYAPAIIVSVPYENSLLNKNYFNFKLAAFGVKDMTDEKLILNEFAFFGKNPEGIMITPYEASSTFDEAVAARATMEKNGLKSLILVTSTYHMRRALTIFQYVFRGSGIQIYRATGTNEFYHPEQWWLGEKDFRRVGEEYLSAIANLITYGFGNSRPPLTSRSDVEKR